MSNDLSPKRQSSLSKWLLAPWHDWNCYSLWHGALDGPQVGRKGKNPPWGEGHKLSNKAFCSELKKSKPCVRRTWWPVFSNMPLAGFLTDYNLSPPISGTALVQFSGQVGTPQWYSFFSTTASSCEIHGYTAKVNGCRFEVVRRCLWWQGLLVGWRKEWHSVNVSRQINLRWNWGGNIFSRSHFSGLFQDDFSTLMWGKSSVIINHFAEVNLASWVPYLRASNGWNISWCNMGVWSWHISFCGT